MELASYAVAHHPISRDGRAQTYSVVRLHPTEAALLTTPTGGCVGGMRANRKDHGSSTSFTSHEAGRFAKRKVPALRRFNFYTHFFATVPRQAE